MFRHNTLFWLGHSTTIQIAPYTTLLINGAGWQPGFPRLMTTEQLAQAQQFSRNISPYGRFRTVADVSCDVNGGLEFVDQSTTASFSVMSSIEHSE